MTTPDNSDRPEPDAQASAAEIEADIARTREDLGEIVDSLTDKFNVKAQARNKTREVTDQASERLHNVQAQGARAVVQLKNSATDERGQLKPAIPAAALALAVTAIAVVIWRKRKP